ncbi:O-antigen/teichoic acid export membrane protein [Mycetocola sp. CAN_C7]|uniref:lipopolysaccharide biosynthesis protein n=1 Tax=Mycetocola sp. CAN_C7 TaxID=2787724 RepID=UPI0018CB15B0
MLAERLARSGSISLFGSVFAAVGAFVLTALVGNGAGAYGTGLFFQAIAVFTIVSQILRLGTSTGIVRQLAGQDAFERRGEAWRTVVIAVVPVTVIAASVSALLSLNAVPVANWLASPGEEESLTALLRTMAPFIAIAAVLGVLQMAVRMIRGVTVFTMLQSILLPASRLAAVAVVIWLTGTVSQYVLAWMIPLPLWLVVTCVVLAVPLVRDWRRRHETTTRFRDEAASFWSFSSARAVGAGLETALEWADVLIVAALASPEAAGIYAVATRTIQAGQVVDRSMRVAVSPTISALLAQGRHAEASTLHTRVTRAMILATWPFYLLLATLGPAVLGIFGPEFREGAIVLAILAGAMMVQSAAGMLQSIILQGGKSSWQMYNKSLALGLNIGLNLLLVPVLGIVGAAITWAVGIIAETLVAAWQVHRRMGVSLAPRRLLFAMALAAVIYGIGGLAARVAFGDSLLVLVVAGTALTAVYAVTLWALRVRLDIRTLWAQLPVLSRFA